MRRFTYQCEPCGLTYERLVGGTKAPPGGVSCRECGKQAPRQWVAPQALVLDSDVEYKPGAMLPISKAHDLHGRDAKQVQKETDTILRSKRKHAQRVKRDHSLSGKRGDIRHIGSIDAREMIAYNRRAGSKNAFFEDPVKALKRTGNKFDG